MKKKPAEDVMHALWGGDAHAIEKMFKSGVNLDTRDASGRTALMEVITEKREDLATMLLAHGADVKVADHEGTTALHLAAHFHMPEIVQKLLDAGAPVNVKDGLGNTPLFHALKSFRGERDGDAIWALLLAGADKTIVNAHGHTAEEFAREPSNYDLGQFFR